MALDLSPIDENLLATISGLHGMPNGAFNIRRNGKLVERHSSANIEISTNSDNNGLEIRISSKCQRETVFIPVILTKAGLSEVVYNNFIIEPGANVEIIAGCGIHNDQHKTSEHSGIHSFELGEGSYVKYVEKHFGSGAEDGSRIMNPKTIVKIGKNATCQMDTSQIGGVTKTKRNTDVEIEEGGKLIITEKLLTENKQVAISDVNISMNGKNSSAQVISRSVAKDNSKQVFSPLVIGKDYCRGHVQCDSIIVGNARVKSVPAIEADSADAQLVHEAAIGKIAGDQITKLMTLGLSEEEAEKQILEDFLS